MKSATAYSSNESYPSGRSRLATIVGSAGLVLLVAGIIWFITPLQESTNDTDDVDTPRDHRLLPSGTPREDLPEPPEIRPEDVTDQPPAEQDSQE